MIKSSTTYETIMNNQDYEIKKRKCWDRYKCDNWETYTNSKEAFYHAFDRAYALGKQEKDAEKSKKNRCEECGAPNSSICAHVNCQDYMSQTESKPAEPKFKVGDKVKYIAHPHNNGIYIVDDIKKSSDGFIYHIQGLIGISNVKESDLEPYTELTEEVSPNVNHSDIDISEIVAKGYVVDPAKQFDNILKDSFSKERRLNIATQMVKAIMQCPEAIERISSAATDSLLDDILHDALYLTDRLMSECGKGGSHD